MANEFPSNEQLENRYRHHAPKGDQAQRYAMIREAVLACAKVIRDLTPTSREQDRAFEELDAAMMFANASIARSE